jgi:hypothetical protein
MEVKRMEQKQNHTTENSGDVSKRIGTKELKPRCTFDFCNTCVHGVDYTDYCCCVTADERLKAL